MKKLTAKRMVLIAVMGTLAYVLMLLRFPLPFMPPFMDFDLAGVPEILGTFILGPISGMFIVTIKLLIKIVTTGSSSMFTGELQNFLLSVSYLLPAWFVYRKKKSKTRLLLALMTGTIVVTIMACFTNIYLIIPFYSRLYNLSMDAIISMTQAVNPYVDSITKLVMIGIVPFNLIKYGVTSLVIFLSIDRLKVIFRRWEEKDGI
ncbi:ECF transporter S component [Enterococcus olivae]